MLHEPMRHLLAFIPLVGIAGGVAGQVRVDGAVRLTGPAEERTLSGAAEPVGTTSAVTVDWAILGSGHWAEAALQGGVLRLTTRPTMTAYRPGMLLRFRNPAGIGGPLTVQCDGLGALPLVRSDGLPPYAAQLMPGAISEMMLAEGRWVLLGGVERGCPPGFVKVNGSYCIAVDDIVNIWFYPAASQCGALGGKLCSWEEYYVGCTQVGNQLRGLFDGWEWIDDTSNHNHTGNQAGGTRCEDHRWAAFSQSTPQARCCYHLR